MASHRVCLPLAVGLALLGVTHDGCGATEDRAKPTHKEVESLGATPETRVEALSDLCLNGEGNLLACDAKRKEIKVISPEGKLVATWQPGLAPEAIHAQADGTVFVGGTGQLARLDKAGKVVKSADAATAGFPKATVSGIAATEKDLFVAFNAGLGFSVYRFDHDFGGAKEIAKGLRGCCGQQDIAAKDGVLYVAENARHRVVRLDRDGKVLSTWGKEDRTGAEGFGSCCNPMNLCFGPGGVLYTSESGTGGVKRFTAEGAFLGLVGTTKGGQGCVRVSVAVNKDGSRVYVADTSANLIRVLAKE